MPDLFRDISSSQALAIPRPTVRNRPTDQHFASRSRTARHLRSFLNKAHQGLPVLPGVHRRRGLPGGSALFRNPDYRLLLRDRAGQERWPSESARLRDQGVGLRMALDVLIPPSSWRQPSFHSSGAGAEADLPLPGANDDRTGTRVRSRIWRRFDGAAAFRATRVRGLATRRSRALTRRRSRPRGSTLQSTAS
jgi:hypothetical protein